MLYLGGGGDDGSSWRGGCLGLSGRWLTLSAIMATKGPFSHTSISNGSAGVGFSSLGASSATAAVSSAGLVSTGSFAFSSFGVASFFPKFLIPLMNRVDRRRPAFNALG